MVDVSMCFSTPILLRVIGEAKFTLVGNSAIVGRKEDGRNLEDLNICQGGFSLTGV